MRGDELLYRPAISLAAQHVEQFIYTEGVATFYADAAGPFQVCLNHTLMYERAGLPIPRTFYCSSANRKLLRSFVARLGGFLGQGLDRARGAAEVAPAAPPVAARRP